MFLLCIQHFTSDFQVVSAMRFFKNASRAEEVQGWKNISHVQSWEGAPPKKDPLTVNKKSRGRVKKQKNIRLSK